MGMPTSHRKSVPPAAAPPVADDSPPLPEHNNDSAAPLVREIGGPAGPEPTRFGDWEKNGRCIDF
jgi:hypothetical protein